ncbi:unnamed protein product [Rotaria sordida]|uniref:Uncharacterized protein n=1 Tax=Rotaria sordida TaxID=392033 RepID=A0A820BYP9_9BILA|nr:unnamed protein product [Rotaria sordida]CAF4213600.1 unnamed protein product [Rotaria sordida]
MYIGAVDLQQCSCHGPVGDVAVGYVKRHRIGNTEKFTTIVSYAYGTKAIKADANDCMLRILTNPTGLKLLWLPGKEGQVPKNAVGFSYLDDETSRVVHIARTTDSKIIGKMHPHQRCLYFPNFEKNIEEKRSEYEILCVADE